MKYKTLLIMLHSLLRTAQICLRMMVWYYTKRYRRKKADRDVRIWAKQLTEFIDLTYTVHNPNAITLNHPNRPTLIMSNHGSHYDIPLIFLTFPTASIRMIAKKELFRIPLFGNALRVTEFVLIDRNNRERAIQNLEDAKQKMASGIVLWLSPEGGRTRDGELRTFKKGGFALALQTGATIIPVGMRNTHKILPAETWDFKTHQHIDIHIGEPIDASTYSDRDHLMADTRKAILTALGSTVPPEVTQ